MNRFNIAAAALAAVIVPALAIASTSAGSASKEISLKGYDLSDPQDVGEIKQRIERAARSLCDNSGRTLQDRAAQDQCVSATVERATTQLEQRLEQEDVKIASN